MTRKLTEGRELEGTSTGARGDGAASAGGFDMHVTCGAERDVAAEGERHA